VAAVVRLRPPAPDAGAPQAAAAAAAPCFVANSSLYLSNVFVTGCDVAVLSAGRPPLGSIQEALYTHIELLGYGRLPPKSTPYTYHLHVISILTGIRMT
jgi:hypothetical protein